jgi:RimJ/RimL family protein N-acetyltransferase/ubiquinone/menaquinone biosynthesis C-methylase UbiE
MIPSVPNLTAPAIAAGSLSGSIQPSLPVPGSALLRPWRSTDAEAVVDAFRDPAIQRWHVRRADSVDEAREWIAGWQRGWSQETELHWALVDQIDDTLLGRVALKGLDLNDGEAGIAYWMVPAARGRGSCTSAVMTLCRWAFQRAGFHRIGLEHSTANLASCRVAVKAGFHAEGIRRGAALHADGWHDMHVHALIAGDVDDVVEADGRARPSGEVRPNDYDGFAEAYTTENEANLVNAHYERPAMLALAGDVTGRRILDAGCGAGPLTAALRERGALVTGIDSSAEMLALAKRRLGPDVALQVVDLRDPLPFENGTFDDVMASLVLHYLPDWEPTLTELRRVLKPHGRLILSIEHPIIAYMIQDPLPDYLATNSYSFEWTFGGRVMPMTFWRRPLQAMFDAFTSAGFHLSLITEPRPDPAAKDLFPNDFEALSTQPNFLFFVLDAV